MRRPWISIRRLGLALAAAVLFVSGGSLSMLAYAGPSDPAGGVEAADVEAEEADVLVPNVVAGAWNLLFFLEPNHTSGAKQCLVFSVTGGVDGEPLSGTWFSPTFAGWNGTWIQEGDRVNLSGSTDAGLATWEDGEFNVKTQIAGQFQHEFASGSSGVLSSAGAFRLQKISACPSAAAASGVDPAGSSRDASALGPAPSVPDVPGIWVITFFAEPGHSTGGSQCLIFTQAGGRLGEPRGGTWDSSTFADWQGEWFMDGNGDLLYWSGYFSSNSGASLAVGPLVSATIASGNYDQVHIPAGSTFGRSAYSMTKVSSCPLSSANSTSTPAR